MTQAEAHGSIEKNISTHTSRVGCDSSSSLISLLIDNFYSHIPCGMWHKPLTISFFHFQFLLTHPVWDVTWHTRAVDGSGCNFYSHIPCGMWRFSGGTGSEQIKISTHTSRVGCDDNSLRFHVRADSFLLTHPVWDVTAIYSIFQSHYSHILQDGPIIHLELY